MRARGAQLVLLLAPAAFGAPATPLWSDISASLKELCQAPSCLGGQAHHRLVQPTSSFSVAGRTSFQMYHAIPYPKLTSKEKYEFGIKSMGQDFGPAERHQWIAEALDKRIAKLDVKRRDRQALYRTCMPVKALKDRRAPGDAGLEWKQKQYKALAEQHRQFGRGASTRVEDSVDPPRLSTTMPSLMKPSHSSSSSSDHSD